SIAPPAADVTVRASAVCARLSPAETSASAALASRANVVVRIKFLPGEDQRSRWSGGTRRRSAAPFAATIRHGAWSRQGLARSPFQDRAQRPVERRDGEAGHGRDRGDHEEKMHLVHRAPEAAEPTGEKDAAEARRQP